MSRLGGSSNQSNPNSRLGQLQFDSGLKPYEIYNKQVLANDVSKIAKGESTLGYRDKLNKVNEAAKAGFLSQADHKALVDALIAGETANIYQQNQAPAWQQAIGNIGGFINEVAVKPVTTAVNTIGNALASGIYNVGRNISGEPSRLQQQILQNDLAFKEAIKNAQKPLISPEAKAKYIQQAQSYSNMAQQLRGQNVAAQQDIVQSMNPEKVGGALLTLGSLAIPAGKTAQVVGRLATPATARVAPYVGRLAEGAVTGGVFGAGTAMNEGKNLEDVLKSSLETATIGAVTELALPPIATLANRALKKTGSTVEELITKLKTKGQELPTPKVTPPEVAGRVNVPVTKVETPATQLATINDTAFAQQLAKISTTYDKEIVKIGKMQDKLTQQLAAKQLEKKYETLVNNLVDNYTTGKLVPTGGVKVSTKAIPEPAQPVMRVPEPALPPSGPIAQAPVQPVERLVQPTLAPETGPISVAGGALKAEQRAIENKLTNQFSNLATYTNVSFKQEAELATQLINADRQQAIKIATGQAPARNEVQRAALAASLEKQAMKTGDTALLQDLASSTRFTKTSEAAQTLAAEGFFFDPTSPVAIINDIKNIRGKVAEGRTKTSANKLVKDEKVKIEKSIKAPSKDDWNAFIEGLRC